MRAYIDSYVFWAIPLASLFHYVSQQKIWLKTITALTVLFCIFLNLFQSYQYIHGCLHWDSMTRESYRIQFLKLSCEPGFNDALKAPDTEKAIKGEDEYEW